MKKALMPSYYMSDKDAWNLGNNVLGGLTGNAFYPAPKVPLADIQTAQNTYTASLAKADKGSSQDKAQKDADKRALIDLLRQECDYVNDTAQGDPIALANCGYPLSKDPQPSVLGTPVISVDNGVSGELISSTPAAKAAIGYRHRYTTDPALALWPEVVTSKATCKISGLVPGTVYHLQIVSIGTNDQVMYSDVVTKMVA